MFWEYIGGVFFKDVAYRGNTGTFRIVTTRSQASTRICLMLILAPWGHQSKFRVPCPNYLLMMKIWSVIVND